MKILKENPISSSLGICGLLFIIALINLEYNRGEVYSDLTWWGQIPAIIIMVTIPTITLYMIGMSIITKFKNKK